MLVIRLGGGRSGDQFMLAPETTTVGRAPNADVFLDDVTVSRDHAVLERRPDGHLPERPGEPERHLREPPASRIDAPDRRRRAADRQVPADLHRALSHVRRAHIPSLKRQLTIGAVCKLLGEEFDDISISKIRFLEDQRLVSPRRTPGGYRLYTADDVERLRADAADAARRVPAAGRDPATSSPRAPHGRPAAAGRGWSGPTPGCRLEELVAETDAEPRFVRELEEFQLLDGAPRRLHPHRRRDRDALPAAGPLRRGGAPPEGVPVGRRPRGRPAGADPGSVAALVEPGAPRGRAARSSRRWPS